MAEEDSELTVLYDGKRPVIRLVLDGFDRHVVLTALLDSGAHRTLFPLSVARELGLARRRLRRGRARTLAGRGLRTHEAPTDVRARIGVVRAGRAELWGPELPLRPTFGKVTQAVLGREDFFELFLVTFHQSAGLLRLSADGQHVEHQSAA